MSISTTIFRPFLILFTPLLAAALAVSTGALRANAAAPLDLGTATGFAVLAGSTITDTGVSTITGNVGLSPGLAVVGFPPALLVPPSAIFVGAAASGPKADLVTAYNLAGTPVGTAGPVGTPVAVDLGGLSPVPGVYYGAGSPDSLALTGTLTLDAAGDSTATWIFQSASTLITASNSVVSLLNGANPCNVFWQVGSSATLGTGSTLVGTVMALTSITATTGAVVSGRLLAQNGAVTLDTNTITAPSGCATTSTFAGTGGVTSSAAADAAAAAQVAAASAAAAAAAATASAAAARLAATGVDVFRPIAVSVFALLLGTAFLSQAARLRAKRRLSAVAVRGAGEPPWPR